MNVTQTQVSLHSPLPSEEWDFSQVPQSEIEVCRLWEYARESCTILDIHRRSQQWATFHLSFKDRQEVVGRDFMKLFNHLGRAAILFQEGLYGFGGNELANNFQSPFPAPWQKLSRNQKDVLMNTASWDVRQFLNYPGFRRCHAGRAHLFGHFEPKTLLEVFGRNPSIGECAHSGHLSRLFCPNYVYKNGTEVLAVEIDWDEYSNEELAAHFLTWLSENRPLEFPSPKAKGKRNSTIFSSLEWLGIARLLHRAPKSKIEKSTPDVLKRFGTSRDWYRDRRKANGCFRQLFPFLPKEEKLNCWQTSAESRR